MHDGPGTLWHPSRRLVLIGLLLLVTVVATEAMAVATVMPLVEEDLGDLWAYGWVFSAFNLGTLVGIVVGGREADRLNPGVPLVLGLGVFCAGLVVAGIAPYMIVVVAGRALQGFGAGAVPTVAYVCVGRGFPPELRPKVFAVLSTAWILPSLAAPLVAPAVADAFGWRWVFLGLVPFAVVGGGLAVRAVQSLGAPSDPVEPDGGRLALVLRLAAGTSLLLAGLTLVEEWIGIPLVVAGAVVLLPAFHSLTPAGTMRLRPRLPAAVGLRGLLTFAFFSADAFVTYAVITVRGRSAVFGGMVLAASALTWAVGSWVQARLSDRWGAGRLVGLGGIVGIASMAIYAAGLIEAVPVWIWFVGAAAAGFGIGVSYSPLSVVTLAEAEPGREGAATTALQLSDVFGIALGTGTAGAIVALGEGLPGSDGVYVAAVFLMSLVVYVGLTVGSPRLVADRVPPTSEAGVPRAEPASAAAEPGLAGSEPGEGAQATATPPAD